jgi:hypothetical protein
MRKYCLQEGGFLRSLPLRVDSIDSKMCIDR